MSQFSNKEKNSHLQKPWWKRVAKVYVLIFVLVLVYILGVATANTPIAKQTPEQVIDETTFTLSDIFAGRDDVDIDVFREAWDILHEDYLDRNNINDRDLFYGAVRGMVEAAGDPHTSFLDPELTKEFTAELNGSFQGIGAEIGRRDGYLVIIAPLPGTPAEEAGLRPGDRILAIDGEDSVDMTVDEAVHRIRGKKGTDVVLFILSEIDDFPRDVTITRDEIDVPSVRYETQDNVAIVRIAHFNADTPDQFQKIAQQVRRDNPAGVIIDLRSNPGGFLHAAVEIASSWLESGDVVVRESFSDKRNDRDYDASREVRLDGFKTVVLIDGGSASASEILAGALQDYEKATIVGSQSFGKGSVQQLLNLKDGASIKVTVARWLTPKGRTIEGEGIMPDIEVEYTIENYQNDEDPQLDRAIDEILGNSVEEE